MGGGGERGVGAAGDPTHSAPTRQTRRQRKRTAELYAKTIHVPLGSASGRSESSGE